MEYETLIKKLRFIMTIEQLGRLSKGIENKEVIIDLHGLSCKEADRMIDNIIALNQNNDFTLTTIHGYIHGIDIKKMIIHKYNSRVIKKMSPANNPGMTILTVAA